MRRVLTAAIVAMSLGGIAPANAFQDVRYGEWVFTIDYDLIGVPQRFAPYQVKACISAANPLPDISREGQECKSQLQGRFGRTYTWSLNCSTEWEAVSGLGRLHYFDDRAHGDVHVQIIHPYNPPQPMIFRVDGQYLGECQSQAK